MKFKREYVTEYGVIPVLHENTMRSDSLWNLPCEVCQEYSQYEKSDNVQQYQDWTDRRIRYHPSQFVYKKSTKMSVNENKRTQPAYSFILNSSNDTIVLIKTVKFCRSLTSSWSSLKQNSVQIFFYFELIEHRTSNWIVLQDTKHLFHKRI